MVIDVQDFTSFITIKQGLDTQSVRHCAVRMNIVNAWFVDKELTNENVEKFFFELKKKGLKNNTLNTYRFVFQHLTAYCKDRGLSYNFFEGFKSYTKTKSDIVIFTLEEIEQIINQQLTYGKFHGRDCSFLDFRYRTMTMFLAYTGCRFGEAANLKVTHLDMSAGKARFIDTKTDENRTVYVSHPLIDNLRILIEKQPLDQYVFRNAMENKVNPQDYSADLKRRAMAAGVTKRTFPHNFRHSYITHMLEAGVQATEIAPLTGHKDIQVIYETYMHLADKTLQNAAMRHPLVRAYLDPKIILQNAKEAIESLKLNNDDRFDFVLQEKNGELNFKLQIKVN